MSAGTILIAAGAAGLIACGLLRAWPYLRKMKPSAKPKRSSLPDIVAAYEVLSKALSANGNAEGAEMLRLKILPAAVQEPK